MKKSNPIIGISPQVDYETGEYKVGFPYTDCLLRLGATPLIFPFTEDKHKLESLIDLCDGFLLTGGHDIHPSYYGEEMEEYCSAPAALRDRQESFLAPKMLQTKKPLLAICRGIQVLNVFCGGTLYQDIHALGVTEQLHRQADTPEAHKVTPVSGTLAADILGTDPIAVNTLHHQAIKDLGQGLRVAAYSEDGLIEAVDMPSRPAFTLGVQWHPELLGATNPLQFKIFERLIKEASAL